MIDLNQFAIFDESQVSESDPGDSRPLFPTPKSFIEQYEQSGVTDVEALGKAYSSAYKDYAKDIGLPKLEREANAKVIESQFFQGQTDPQSFYQNYQRLTTPGEQQSDNAEQTDQPEEAGLFESIPGGFTSSIGSSISGLEDLGNATDARFGRVERLDGDILPTYIPPDEIQLWQRYFPEAMGLQDTPVRQAGEAVSSLFQVENPNVIGNAIGSATGTLATVALGGAAGLGAKGAIALGITQSASQLANEGREDYLNEMRKQGFELNPEQLANTTLLNSALASADLFPGGRIARSMGLTGLDAATGNVIKKALIGAGSEGIAEVAQTIASNFIAQGIVKYDEERDLWEGTVEAAQGGAGAGAFMNAVAHLIGGRRASGGNDQQQSETSTVALPDTVQAQPTAQVQNPLSELATQQAGREVQAVNQELNAAATPPDQVIDGLTPAQTRSFIQSVVDTESSGQLDVINQYGYSGAYQFGAAALTDVGLIKRDKYDAAPSGVKRGTEGQLEFLRNPDNWTIEGGLDTFLKSREIQDKAFIDLTNINIRRGQASGAIDENADAGHIAGYAKAAHLVGSSAADRFVLNGTDRSDANGTTASRYYEQGKNAVLATPPAVTTEDTGITIRINQGYQESPETASEPEQGQFDDEVVTADDLVDAPQDDLVDVRPEQQPVIPEDQPRTVEIFDANNDTYQAEYDIVDAGSIDASIDKASNQYRDRNRAALQEQVDSIAGDLTYGRLNTLHSTFTDGSPVLTKENNLVASNGRVLGIQKAYANGNAEAYRNGVISDAESLGFDPDVISQMESPVLVRRLKDDIDTNKLAIISNVGSSAEMSDAEQAKVDAERINSLHDFDASKESIDLESAKGLFQRLSENVPDVEKNKILKNGRPTNEGTKRVRNALVFMAYGDSDLLERVAEGDKNEEGANIRKALLQAAPALAEMRDGIRSGRIYDADISDSLNRALSDFIKLRTNNQSVDQAISNNEFDFSPPSPEVKKIIQRLHAGVRQPTKLKDFLVNYAEKLKGYGNPNQQGLFGDNPTPTQAEVLERAGQETDGQTAETATRQTRIDTRPATSQDAGGQAAEQPRPSQANEGSDGRSGAVRFSLDQSIDNAVAESGLSALQEDALTEVFGSQPKNQKIIDRKLREYFAENYQQSDDAPNSRAFVTEQMRQLRDSGALQRISDDYLNNNLQFGLNDGVTRNPIPSEKAEEAIRRVLGDVPFETTIPDDIRAQAGDAASRVKGAFANGRIYIDTSNIGSIAEAEAIAVEELTHRGVANLFGDEYDQQLNSLYTAMGEERGVRRFIERNNISMAEDYFNQSPVAQMDELLAHIEANSDSLTVRVKRVFQRIMGLLRENIRKLNTRVLHNVSDSDVVLLARRARDAAQSRDAVVNQDPRFGIRPEREAAEANERERIQRQFNNRYRPGLAERVKTYLNSTSETTQDRYQETKQELYNKDSDFWRDRKRWLQRYFYSDSTIGRDVADARRGIDWKRAATHDSVVSDVVLLESMIQNIYGKHRRDLSDTEVEQFHRVITGQDQFAKPELQSQVAYFRKRIDDTSQALINEKYAEMGMRINELDDKGRIAAGRIAQDLISGKEDVAVPPALARIASLQRQINTIDANKGEYLHRSYRAFTDPQWPKKARKLAAWDDAIELIKEDHLNDTGFELTDAQAQGRLNRWLEDAANHDSMIEFSSGGQGTNEGLLKRRKDIPEVLRQVLGEFKDPVYNYANTITQVSDYVAKQQYQMALRQLLLSMDDIAFIGKAPENMKVSQFPQTAAWSPLSDLWVDAEFMRDLDEFGVTADIGNPLMKKAIQLSAAVKIGKTALSPTTMARNFWSGFLLLAGAGHSPFGGMTDAYDVIRNAKNRVGTFSGNLELSKPEAEELNQKYILLGVRRDGATSGELADIFRDFQKTDTAIKEKGIARKSFDAALAAYQFGDDFFKIMHFEKGYADLRKAGLSHAQAELEAAKRTRDTMPTYSMVPRALQHLRQFNLAGTFVSFPFEVMRNLKNNINYIREDRRRYQETGNEQWRKMSNKRIMGMFTAYALPSILAAYSLSLAELDEEDNEALDHFSSDWRRGQLRLFLGSDQEDLSYVDLTSLVPSEYIMRALRVGMIRGGEQGVWSGVLNTGLQIGEPFYSFDIATKGIFNFFTNTDDNGFPIYGEGKSFTDLVTQPGENQQHLSDAAEYLIKQFGPGAIQNINDFTRALSGSVADAESDGGDSWFDQVLNERSASLGGKISRSGKEFNTADALAALGGFRVTTQNMTVLGQQASQQTRNKIAAYSSEFKRSVDVTNALSDEYIDNRIRTLMADRQRAYDKMLDLVKYYEKKGKTSAEIAEMLYVKNRTLGREATRQIANGNMPPFKLSKELMSNSLRTAGLIKDPAARFRAKQALTARYRYIQQRVNELQRGQ